MSKRIGVIGGGFAGLATACCLAQKGFRVTLFEKNETTGGRARVFRDQGFTFDMGPSWYWMPEIFENFFGLFGKKVSDYYDLVRLDPSYRVFFSNHSTIDVPATYSDFKKILEDLEPGSGNKLDQFIHEAKVKYNVSMGEFVWKPSLSVREYFHPTLLTESFRLQLFSSFSSHIKKFFTHPKILKLLEFPVLFLGAKPENTPAMYSMMNYADIVLGTWYPKGGMCKISEAMTSLAKEIGVEILTNCDVQKINVQDKMAVNILVNGETLEFDSVVATADYHHVETNLLDAAHRSYSESYWSKRVMSPSSLIFYIGLDKTIDGLLHHNLFFDTDFQSHAASIYDSQSWPEKPLFYLCCPSKTDNEVAPQGKESFFILIPVATGLSSDETLRAKYLDICIERIQEQTGHDIRPHIIFNRSYAHEEFTKDYYSFRGNAYGLANTLKQTAIMKPKMRSKKVRNLFYAGQLTVPGPGVPPSLISGQIAAQEVEKYLSMKG